MRQQLGLALSFLVLAMLALVPLPVRAGGEPKQTKGEPKKPKTELVITPEGKLYAALTEIAKRGVTIYNEDSDPLSCSYLFEGGLLAALYQLDDHPEIQKDIADGLKSASLLDDASKRALELRSVIDGVRRDLKPHIFKKKVIDPKKGNGEKNGPPKKGSSNLGTDPKKPKNQYPKLIENKPAPPPKLGVVGGQVAFRGQPLQGVWVVFWTEDFNTVASRTDEQGRFAFPQPIPVKEYLVTVNLPFPAYQAPPGFPRIPQRYSNPLLTPLKVQTQEKGVQVALDLQ